MKQPITQYIFLFFLIITPSTLRVVPPTALTMLDEVKQDTPQKNRQITITTKITEPMLKYSYFGVSYKPDFSLKINNEEVKCSDTKKITIAENKMKVRYDYNFSGFKKGAKEVVFEVPKDVDTIDITFSWDNRWRVIANKATPRKIKVIA